MGFKRTSFTVNTDKVKCSALVNGSQLQKFITEILPFLQTLVMKYEIDINICYKTLKKTLQKVNVNEIKNRMEMHTKEKRFLAVDTIVNCDKKQKTVKIYSVEKMTKKLQGKN